MIKKIKKIVLLPICLSSVFSNCKPSANLHVKYFLFLCEDIKQFLFSMCPVFSVFSVFCVEQLIGL